MYLNTTYQLCDLRWTNPTHPMRQDQEGRMALTSEPRLRGADTWIFVQT